MPNPPTFWMFDPDWGTFWQIFGAVCAIALSVVGLFVAWRIARRQFTIMEEQGEVINKQIVLMERQAEVLDRLESIEQDEKVILADIKAHSETQARIAETQRKIMEQQMERRANLLFVLTGHVGTSGAHSIAVLVRNEGSKRAETFHWSLFVPVAEEANFQFTTTLKPRVGKTTVDGEVYKVADGEFLSNTFPDVEQIIGHLVIRPAAITKPLTVLWQISADDGLFPGKNLYGRFMIHDGTIRSLDPF